MTFRVLQDRAENDAARLELVRRGISYWPKHAPHRMRDRIRGLPPIAVGDERKSWDVLATIRLLELMRLHRDPIVDLGAFASEALCCLHTAGFRELVGVDLDPRVTAMPFARNIEWRVCDMMSTGLQSGTFGAVLSISAIEHGFDEARLFKEVARLLRPGGLFVGSTDYWPEKIDTTGVKMLGMDWKIFSAAEIDQLFETAKRFGLEPTGVIRHEAKDRCIEAAGRHYTFGWFALRRAR